MMVAIIISLIPLVFKDSTALFDVIDKATAAIFILDYLARLLTADYKLSNGPLSFLIYPFTPMAVIDLLAILPSFTPMAAGWKLVKLFRLFRTFRVFRSFKMFRYSKSLAIIVDVIKAQRAPLIAVCSMAIAYILISALVIFNVEPDTFNTFFDAIYWATVSLTTMGYGDIYPVTTAGRIVTMISSFVGIAIVALPASIITAGYMEQIGKQF
jgi:voltage-gated potassium channel